MSKIERERWNKRINLRKWDIRKFKQAEELAIVVTACICTVILLLAITISALTGGVLK